MSSKKISGLTDGGLAQAADEFVIARGGANYRVSAANLGAALAPVVNLATQYGISTANSAAANGAALDQAFSDHGGAVVYVLPAAGTPFSFTGGHTLPYGARLIGQGVAGTVINHTSNDTFLTINQANGTEQRQGASDFKLVGNSGASAMGIVFQDTNFGPYLERVRITGYTAGVGIQLHNLTSGAYCEGIQLLNVSITNCLKGIQFKRTSGTNSFKGFYTRQLGINVPSGGTGIDFAVGGASQVAVYDSHLHGYIWFAGGTSSGVGWDVGALAVIEAAVDFHWESNGSGTTYWLQNAVGGIVNISGRVAPAGIPYNVTPQNTVVISPGWASPQSQMMGFKGETLPLMSAPTIQAITSGKVYAVGVWLPEHFPIKTLTAWVDVAAATVTTARFGVWDQNFNLLASTPNDTALFASTGLRSKDLSTPYTVPYPGIYYIGLISVATTPGNFARGGPAISGGNLRMGSNAYAYAAQSGQTDLTNPLVPGSGVGPLGLWIGIS